MTGLVQIREECRRQLTGCLGARYLSRWRQSGQLRDAAEMRARTARRAIADVVDAPGGGRVPPGKLERGDEIVDMDAVDRGRHMVI